MNYTSIIFDLDGVLCKTDEYHYLAWEKVTKERKFYFDRKINNQLRGVSRLDCVDIILSQNQNEYTQEEKMMMASEKNEMYVEFLNNMSANDLCEGANEILQHLKNFHYKIAIASASKNAKHALRQLQIFDMFDVIVDGNDVSKTKPDPEIYLTTLLRLKEKNHNALVIEDATVGLKASRSAGIDVVAYGYNCDKTYADYHIEKLTELFGILATDCSERRVSRQ